MAALYQTVHEEQMHLKAMRQIAGESGRDLQLIREVYEGELSRLLVGAHLRDYLPVLAARRARERLARVTAHENSTAIH